MTRSTWTEQNSTSNVNKISESSQLQTIIDYCCYNVRVIENCRFNISFANKKCESLIKTT